MTSPFSDSVQITTGSEGGTDDTFTNSIGQTFVYIQPGTFMMGSPTDEPCRESDETQHEVILTQGFYMQTTEVTQGQWQAVMGSNPSYFQSCGADCPVEQVSWNGVQNFINQLNALDPGHNYCLPTEAQWEYAARAGSSTTFANGNIASCKEDPNMGIVGWYWYNSSVDYSPNFYGLGPHTAAGKQPNTWGLYDMHGNVWEWCADWYGSYPAETVTDPTGPASAANRIFRGGSWGNNAKYCRSGASRQLLSRERALRSGFSFNHGSVGDR